VLGTKLGLDPQTLLQCCISARGSCRALDRAVPEAILPRNFDAVYTVNGMIKDLECAIRTARESGVRLLLPRWRSRYTWKREGLGHSDQHLAAVIMRWKNCRGRGGQKGGRTMKVVIIGDFTEGSRKRIVDRFPVDWKIAIVSAAEAGAEITDAEVIIPEHIRVDGPFLEQTKKLKLVQTGAGFDNVVIPECTKRGIYVASGAGVNTVAVAEHVLAFICCWFKAMIFLDGIMKRGEFGVDYQGAEIAGRTLGIIGNGSIGKAVAHRALAFEMKVLGYDVRPVETEPGVEMTDLSTLLKTADIVTLHTFLNEQTRRMIGRNELSSMKRSGLPDQYLPGGHRGRGGTGRGAGSEKDRRCGLDVLRRSLS